MANTDPLELLAQIEDLRRRAGLIDETSAVPPRMHFSPSDAVELAKFEQFPSQITAVAGKPPGNPWKFRPYPRMLYMARQHPSNGKWTLCLERPERYNFPTENQWDMAMEQYRQFAASCIRMVQNEQEHKAARLDGWRDSSKEALEFREQEFKAQGQEAAERAYRDRNMSEAAQAEVAKAEAEHFGHLPNIPEKPKRKYTRKAKPAESPAA